ncbi:MAG: tetratricopeptide repeat protein [Elusimicrobiota bacterium]
MTAFLRAAVLFALPFAVWADERSWDEHLKAARAAGKEGRCAAMEEETRKALAEAEAFGPGDLRTARTLENLAGILHAKGDLSQAEELHLRALKIKENVPGSDMRVALTLHNLAGVHKDQKRHAQARAELQRALKLFRRGGTEGRHRLPAALASLGHLYEDMGRLKDSERELLSALRLLDEKPQDALKVSVLMSLASVHEGQGRTGDAEKRYREGMDLGKKAYGEDHPKFAADLETYADFLKKTDRPEPARMMMESVARMRAKHRTEGKTCPGEVFFQLGTP